MPTKVTDHFSLEELIPDGMNPAEIPVSVRANLVTLAESILEPARVGLGLPFIVSGRGYRPPARNQRVGGVSTSDHMTGCAVDFHAAATSMKPWDETTRDAFDWIRIHLDGRFGQLIWEDQRGHFGLPGKLWVHVALRTEKHPGTPDDVNRILVCSAPKVYRVWMGWNS